MAPPNPATPGLLSVPRITTLLASLIVAVGSGTNYVRFSPWITFSLLIERIIVPRSSLVNLLLRNSVPS
jgi:hypothetical protein